MAMDFGQRWYWQHQQEVAEAWRVTYAEQDRLWAEMDKRLADEGEKQPTCKQPHRTHSRKH